MRPFRPAPTKSERITCQLQNIASAILEADARGDRLAACVMQVVYLKVRAASLAN